jgi:hypothetical protein
MKNFSKAFAAGLGSILIHFIAIFLGTLTVFCWMSINDCNNPWGAVGLFFCAVLLTLLESGLIVILGQSATGKIQLIGNNEKETEDSTNEN